MWKTSQTPLIPVKSLTGKLSIRYIKVNLFHSVLHHSTNEKIKQIPTENEDIISLIRELNPNDFDGISGQMLLLCDDSVILPLRIIFRMSGVPSFDAKTSLFNK